ncbi:MAG: type II toxin-antitoxin system MqsA family antitoxin [Candidatus Omnitrophica bacterium]|nr:type II toxin-antitoxin system MqsA family antitoxin [Candidatus Omnitrophota bacterium]
MKKKDFKDLLRSIDQARKIHNGKLQPGKVLRFNPVAVTNIRKRLHVSQAEFAYMIGVSIDTLQNWEQGRRRPEGPALALLKIAELNPETVIRALHA